MNNQLETKKIIEEYPLVPLREMVMLPHTLEGLSFGRLKSKLAVEAALAKDQKIILVAQKESQIEDPSSDQVFSWGTLGIIRQIMKSELDIKALVEGLDRVRIIKFIQNESFFKVQVEKVEDDFKETDETVALKHNLLNNFRRYLNLGRTIPFEVMVNIFSTTDPNRLINMISNNLDLSVFQKEEILETIDLADRLEKANQFVAKAVSISGLEQKLASRTQEELSKMQKEVFLREQLKTIQKELGESEGNEFEELRKKIESAGMAEEVKAKALKELSRLEKMPSFSPEVSYLRTYLDWMVELPWGIKTETDYNIKKANRILNEDHFGLKKVKERILEYLAVQKLVGKIRGPILCFVGPPGTGKTSIGRSIARALGRKFIKISLGGIRDEAEIRGHRRTYVGALPGRVIQGIRTAGSKNPVFMLDEVDKVGADFRGDPSAALLEALDPEQNFGFSDHYLEVPFDLSDVIFITTANILDTIPPALRDRMEVIEFPGYTEEEKFHIARDFLIPKLLQEHGLKKEKVLISDGALKKVITFYTREAGVRNLERELARLFRKIARSIAEDKKVNREVDREDLEKFLGPEKFEPWTAEITDQIGVVSALAWTESGGEVLSVEATLMPGGKGNLILTGQLGEVMKESAQAALSFARTQTKKFNINPEFIAKNDVHIHVPMGAIPKDGPSAGIAMGTALVSALAKIPVDREIGITGEITLRGQVLKIGGIKEKILAAHRAGLKKIILPAKNKKDLAEIPLKTRQDLEFTYVKEMNQVLEKALVK